MKTTISILSLAAAVTALTACKSTQPTVSAAAPQTAQARIVQSRQQQIPATVSATGTLHARESATLSAQVMGRVQQVLVREGDTVRAGQALLVLDDATLNASAQQADAAYQAAQNQQLAAQKNADLAASTLARYRQLQAQRSVSAQEMDEVTRRAEAASAQVDALRAQANAVRAQQAGARAMLAYTRITAPFAAVVTARMVDPGAMAAPGVPLIQLDSSGPLQLQITVPESAIASVHERMKVTVHFDSLPSADPAGTVSQIVPAADPASHSILVKIDLPASRDLRPGMYASAEIPTGTRQAIIAPQSAIVQRGSLPCAYALDANGIAQLRYVTLGAGRGGMVEILSGLAAGEKLVDNPGDRDLAGKRIEVQP